MKKLILLIAVSISILTVSAQEKLKQQELGLVFQSLDNFGVMYKFGHQKSMWRLKSIYGTTTNYKEKGEYEENSHKYNQFGIGFGKQYNASIDEHLDFIYGMDITGKYSSRLDEEFDSESELRRTLEDKRYSVGLNFVLGFNYVLNQRFVFGVELLPGLDYSTSTTSTKYEKYENDDTEIDESGLNIGLSSSSALLSIAYRF